MGWSHFTFDDLVSKPKTVVVRQVAVFPTMSSKGNGGMHRWEGLGDPKVPETLGLDADAMVYVASVDVQEFSPVMTQ